MQHEREWQKNGENRSCIRPSINDGVLKNEMHEMKVFWFHIAVRDHFINDVWARVRKLRDNSSIGNRGQTAMSLDFDMRQQQQQQKKKNIETAHIFRYWDI